VALAGIEIEPGAAQPADGKIFERVSDLEDPQSLAGKLLALILRRARELELQSALTAVSKAGAAEVGPRRHRPARSGDRLVDHRIDALGAGGAVVLAEHQNGRSV